MMDEADESVVERDEGEGEGAAWRAEQGCLISNRSYTVAPLLIFGLTTLALADTPVGSQCPMGAVSCRVGCRMRRSECGGQVNWLAS